MLPSLSIISKTLSNGDSDAHTNYEITVLRNITVEPIEPYLRFLGQQSGLNCKIHFGDYDAIVQNAMDLENALLHEGTDCVIVFARLEQISWALARTFPTLDSGRIESEVNRVIDFVETVVAAIRKRTQALILWHGLEVPPYPTTGLLDSHSQFGHRATIVTLNDRIREVLTCHKSSYLIDLDTCFSRLGYAACLDARFWHIGRAPYTATALSEVATEDFKYIRASLGKNKKCLVLDCDNVLWGGVAGEDGLDGIKLGKEYPGSAYFEFQQEVVNLYHRGIIIALCSKNNANDVWEVFESHPEMVVQRKHIAASQINWEDKASNIRKLADTLNIGLDSMVFVDDSDYEVALVRRELPEVTVVHLPPATAVENRNVLNQLGIFDALSVTQEDAHRGEIYQAERLREDSRNVATDIESYCRSLEMVLTISLANNTSLARIAQQTQKTNQFNLTTRKYSEAEIAGFSDNECFDVLTLQVSDVFGDSGIVGTSIIRYEDKTAILDSFLLSCRALGRGVEKAFLQAVVDRAREKEATTVVGTYIPTKKNGQTKNFLSDCGFQKTVQSNDDSPSNFVYKLAEHINFTPDFFKQVIAKF
jgi:FkbH-like protein